MADFNKFIKDFDGSSVLRSSLKPTTHKPSAPMGKQTEIKPKEAPIQVNTENKGAK